MTKFRIPAYDKDPLEFIVRHKDVVKSLSENGIDGMEIRKMLDDWHGVKVKIPVLLSERNKQENKQIEYAIRRLSALRRSEVIECNEKKSLERIIKRLSSKKIPGTISRNLIRLNLKKIQKASSR